MANSELKDKVIGITGASSGFGQGAAQAMFLVRLAAVPRAGPRRAHQHLSLIHI